MLVSTKPFWGPNHGLKFYVSRTSTYADGSVETLLVLPDGKVLAGGDFTYVNTTLRRGLVQLDAEGEIDAGFSIGLGAEADTGVASINALAFTSDGKLVAAGEFNRFDGVARRNLVRLNYAPQAPRIVTHPSSRVVAPGQRVSLSVTAVGASALSYQWLKDGVVLPGESQPLLLRHSALASDSGSYTVRVTSANLSVTSDAASLLIAPAAVTTFGQLLEIEVGPALREVTNIIGVGLDGSFLAIAGGKITRYLPDGFVVRSDEPGASVRTLVRGVGPTLTDYGVSRVAADPELHVYRAQQLSLINNDWSADRDAIAAANQQTGAFVLRTDSKGAALVANFAEESTTAHVINNGGTTGVALVELYALASGSEAAKARLVNISTRTHVASGDEILIAGFVVAGGPKRLLIRVVGPTLETYGVATSLGDSRLRLYHGSTLIAENDDWALSKDGPAVSRVFSTSGAFTLPDTSRDAAWVGTLAPGIYTVHATGSDNGSGVALIEVYDLDP